MEVLVLGKGKLGSSISSIAGWTCVSRADGFEAEDPTALHKYIPEGVDVIVNCVAHTETYSDDRDKHWSINYAFVQRLATYCEERGIKLVHISTDYVYANSTEHPTVETAVPVHAESWYAYSKVLGDAAVQLHTKNHLICRCTHKSRETSFEVAYIDRITNYAYTDEIAQMIVELINNGAEGVYNVGPKAQSAFDWLKSSVPGLVPGNTPPGLPRDTSMDVNKMNNFMNMKDTYTLIEECPITGSSEHFTYFDLGNFPLVNNLHDTQDDSLNCQRYPLRINYFKESGLSALSHAVDGEILFKNYLYKSEVNIPYIKHCKSMYKYIQKFVDLADDDLLVDIGGNDGSLSAAFKDVAEANHQYLNIDPSENLASLSIGKGIPVLTEFFSADSVNRVSGKAKVVTSTNVFQHLKDTNSFAEGVSNLLSEEGIWVLEFPYWIHDMETKQFDQTYHEHIYYYTVSALKLMMEKHGMKIINATEHEIHGGSMRLVMALKASSHKVDATVKKILDYESTFDEEYYQAWGAEVALHLRECRELVRNLKAEGKRVAGFGAAAKGCIFLNAAGLNYTDLEYIVDDTDLKQGKYVPGTGIPIAGRSILQEQPVDYILILAHNFADHIIESLKDEFNGKFLVFLPEIKELELC